MKLFPTHLPRHILMAFTILGIINVGTMEEPLFYSDYVLLTFPLANAIDIEEVMDMMEDDMQLIMLYHHIPSQHTLFGHSACAYSNPSFGQMFKMNVATDGNEMVNCVKVTIYDSLETLCNLRHTASSISNSLIIDFLNIKTNNT